MSISKMLFIIGSIILLSVFWRPSDQFAFRVFFGLGIWGLAWFFRPRYDTSFDRGSLLPPLDGRSAKSVKSSVADPYAKLLGACGGDHATVDRLIAYEMTQDRRLSKNAAALEALDRLYIDRRHRF